VTVDFATRDGTALAGADYVATNGTLTFGSGITHATFDVPIIDDSVIEPVESINLQIFNPMGGALVPQAAATACPFAPGDPLQAQLFILDNDEPTNTFATAPTLDVTFPVAQAEGSLSALSGYSSNLWCFTNPVPRSRAWIYVDAGGRSLSPYFSHDSVVSLYRADGALIQ